MDIKCRLCLFKTERDESVNIFTPGKSNELISDTIMSFVPIELSRDDDLPQTICNICLQKLDSITEFRRLILNSDMELKIKSQEIIVKLKTGLSAAIKQSQKIQQKSENIGHGDSANYVSDNIELETHDVKLETDSIMQEQSSEGNGSKEGARLNGHTQQSDEKLYRCEECGKTFKYKSLYIAHNRRHTGDMPYHCDICNKGFPMKSFMVYHRRIHFDERPFKCEECPKSFKLLKSCTKKSTKELNPTNVTCVRNLLSKKAPCKRTGGDTQARSPIFANTAATDSPAMMRSINTTESTRKDPIFPAPLVGNPTPTVSI
jgi:transposase-like protein